MEDNIVSGGVGEKIASNAAQSKKNFTVFTKGFPEEFIPAGRISELFKLYGLDAESLAKYIKEIL